MIHLLQVEKPESTRIEITIEKEFCSITLSTFNDMVTAHLPLKDLHEFIGTLLHVQQKIKNR